jgi:hypothetical protein
MSDGRMMDRGESSKARQGQAIVYYITDFFVPFSIQILLVILEM